MIKKIFVIFVCFLLLFSSFIFPVSAVDTITEYYDYNGQAISSSVADILSGIAVNVIRQYPDLYRYWAAIRVGEYRYAVVLFYDYSSYQLVTDTLSVSLDKCCVYYYNQRLASFQSGTQTRYQAGVEPYTPIGPVNLQLTRGYVLGNVDGCIAVHPEYESVLYFDYIVYILFALCFFLLIFIAFKFLNKRWLLP